MMKRDQVCAALSLAAVAVYDFTPGAAKVLFALGSTDVNGTYSGQGGRYAWAAPFVRFDTASLWKEKRPARAPSL